MHQNYKKKTVCLRLEVAHAAVPSSYTRLLPAPTDDARTASLRSATASTVPTLAGVGPIAGVEEDEAANWKTRRTHTRDWIFGAAKEPPRFLMFLLYIETKQAGHLGHDARTTRHAPSRAAPSHSSERAARLAQSNRLRANCAHVEPLYRTRPKTRAQPTN